MFMYSVPSFIKAVLVVGLSFLVIACNPGEPIEAATADDDQVVDVTPVPDDSAAPAASNQPPVITDQTLSGLAFATPVQDTLTFSDADSSSFSLLVTAQGSQGTVTITDADTGAFDYTLTSADALDGDSFTVQLSDGTTSVSAIITLTFADATAPVVAFTPLDAATSVALSTNLVLTSDDPLDSSTVTVQNSAGVCSGSLQVSLDSFANCLALSGLTISNLARTVTVTPAMTLTESTVYQVRATTNLTNRFGTAAAATEQRFTAVDNQPPVMADQTLSGLAFATTVQDTLTFTDTDSSSFTLVVTAQGAFGTVTFTDADTGAFDYLMSSADALDGDSFTVDLSDGTSTVSAVITLAFADATAPVVAFTPLDAATNVALATDLVLTSDDPLDSSTVTVQSSDATCSGSLQLSVDSFANCLALTGVTISNLARTVTLTPAATLTENAAYQVRATATLTSTFGAAIAVTEQGFTTVENGYLMINEVGSSYYSNALRWFELYNGTGATINVADYTFNSYAATNPSSAVANANFALPSQNILPGQYLVVRSQDFNQTYTDNSQVVYIQDGADFPYWTSDGYIELIHTATGDTVDYVKFGQNFTPTDASAWSGAQTTLVSTNSSFGQSIGRDASHSDTNTAADWTAYNPGTFGAVNDVECATDADFDMIPDCNEAAGKTFAGMPLYDWGARPGVTDIFIEIDYMDSNDEGITPRKEALDNVVAAFAPHNIAIHFDVGDLYDQVGGSLDPLDYDLGGGQQVPLSNGMHFSPGDGRADFYDYKDAYFSTDRLQFFHYLIFANSQNFDGSAGSSGLAEIVGNDLIVSLGNWGLSAAGDLNKLINYQASTLMHELGHNLGLHHGGNESANYKPNYLSVMNYTYQLRGLPTIGDNEGDRMHEEEADACTTDLINGPSDNHVGFVLDFSDNSSNSLNEASLNETLGFGRTGSQAVDFNCASGATETALSNYDINKDSLFTTLTDHDDWANLVTDFGGLNNQSIHGAQLTEQIDTPFIVWPVRVQYDRMPYIVETMAKPE